MSGQNKSTPMDEYAAGIDHFAEICSQRVDTSRYSNAASVDQNIPIYKGTTFRSVLGDPNSEANLRRELCNILKEGPGIFVVTGAYPDVSIVDRSTAVFRDIVTEERASGVNRGDHFGSNERIWNVLQKVAVRDPELFVDYYSNPIMAVAAESWLGPFYQVTAQMNNVRPGSPTQLVHRDYHLGFQAPQTVARFPLHVQVMSQYLTLQGAVAHVDMPLESGPTMLLPFSQQFEAGYLSYGSEVFREYFDDHHVQLPLRKGDMVFFSPAVFHGAGKNDSANDRVANLLQISSAFGKTMETVSHTAMVESIYPTMLSRISGGTITEREVRDTVAAAADGYSFPTNLDADPPAGGNAPETGQQLMARALSESWAPDRFNKAMASYLDRRQA